MKCLLIIMFALALVLPLRAQTNEVDWDAVMNSAQQWANDNLDDDVLKALQDVDRHAVEDFLNNYQQYLKGDYVLDMAQVKDAATTILPILDAHEETRPYAAWLRSRLDYFEAAEAMQSTMPAPGTNAPVQVNPSFKTEQEIWIRKVNPRPWPKAAVALVPKLKPIFAAEQVPTELVWLAEVESGFDASARSPAGALGMFQLMPQTAKDMGLSLWPRDQRRQLDASGHAAARCLRELHHHFGDWRLAVAAYNCGEGTVQKSLQRYHATRYEDIATHLPAETQMYVPKVEATIQHREGRELEKLKAPAK